MELSIVIVNHNTPELTQQTIESIVSSTHCISYEVIVVDNSTDQMRVYQKEMPNQTVFTGVENRGFGHACNLGASKAQGEYILFLNSDTILHDGALDKSVAYLREHPEVGALGIRTLLADGSLDHGCKRGFPTPSSALYYYLGLDKKHPESRKYGAYRQTFLPEDKTNEVDAVSGSFLLAPRSVLEEVGGFDEAFFMYGEDLDLCYRIRQQGYAVVYYADAVMTHLKGQSGLHTKSKTVIYHFYHAMILFYKKHYRGQYPFLVTMLVYCGVWSKYALTRLKAKWSR